MSILESVLQVGSRRRAGLGILKGDEGWWMAECERDIYRKVKHFTVVVGNRCENT